MMVDMETIEIPGAPTFARTFAIPPISVSLPLEVRTRVSLQLLYALFTLAAGTVGILVVFLLTRLLVSHPCEWVAWFAAVGCLPVSLFIAIWGLGTTWVCLTDAARPDPVLIVRKDGIEDQRAEAMIPWATVTHVRIVYFRGGLNHLHLTLRTPIRARHNPFRAGTTAYPWRRRPDTLRIPIVLLDVKPYTLAQVVSVLVRRHGGEISTVGGPVLQT